MKAPKLIALLSVLLAFGARGTLAQDDKLTFISIEAAASAPSNAATGDLARPVIDSIRVLLQRLERSTDVSIAPLARCEWDLASGVDDCTILVPFSVDLPERG